MIPFSKMITITLCAPLIYWKCIAKVSNLKNENSWPLTSPHFTISMLQYVCHKDLLIDFNGMSIRLGLFYTSRFGNPLIFCVVVFKRFFFLPTQILFLVCVGTLHLYRRYSQCILSFVDWALVFREQIMIKSLRDLGSIPGRVIPKTLKMVLDTS